MINFFKKDKAERLVLYTEWYNTEKLSWSEIAKKVNTYTNKVRRDATKLGVESRDKAEAQKLALDQGRHTHPTKGKTLDDETKQKISESQGKVWDSLTEEEKELRSKIGKEAWDKKTDQEKQEFFRKSALAIQEASRSGSKMELFIYESLLEAGYRVDRHKEHILQNEKFHIDLYVPKLRAAIEIDGPMHFEPVFGEDKLNKRQAADTQKNGLILSSGMVLIRVKLTKRDSQRYMREVRDRLKNLLDKVEKKFPANKSERYFEI